MDWVQALQIKPGITAAVGSGGKSTLLRVLSAQLAGARVVVCTTTHIYPVPGLPWLPGDDPDPVRRALAGGGAVCLGATAPGGKLTAPALPMAALAALADYVLVEADGAARRPLKAHAPHEPVIPAGCGQVICLAGLGGLGQPIAQAAHRPERFAELAGAEVSELASPAHLAAVLRAERLADRVLLNQADTPGRQALARQVAEQMDGPVYIGALEKGLILC